MSYFNDLEHFSTNIAAVDESNVYTTYKQLIDIGDGIAKAVGKRCLVFLMTKNNVATISAYIGFLRNNIVPVMINRAISEELLKQLEQTYHPAYLYYLEERLTDEQKRNSILHIGESFLVKTSYEQDYSLNKELGLLLTTSGSTGSPKLVRQSYKNLEANTNSIIEYLEIVDTDRAITTLPMHYTYGLSIVNTHLESGAMLILTDATLMEKKFWSMLTKYGATTFGGVPYIYEMLKKMRFERMNMPTLRYLTQAGGKLSADLVKEYANICQKKNIKMIVMYGQTEATARMSYLPWNKIKEKSGSIGIAIPGGKLWIADAEGNAISDHDIIGELVYEGPNVTLGYARNRQDLVKGDERNGVLRTGDMAKTDSDGYFYIVGRKKRFLKIFGSRVNLDEVEGLLKKQGIECVCSGIDDNLKVFVIDIGNKDTVIDYITNDLKIPRAGIQVFEIPAIPRNEAGKVLYSALPH